MTSCAFPSFLHLLLFLSVGVSFVGGFRLQGGILVFPASTHSFFMVGLLRALGVHAKPSLFSTLPGACGPSSLRDEVQTLPGWWAHSRWVGTLLVTGHASLVGACSLSSLPDEVRELSSGWIDSPVAGHTPRSLGTLPQVVPVVSPPSEMRCGHSLVDGHTPRSLGALLVAGHPPVGEACSQSSLLVEVRTVP